MRGKKSPKRAGYQAYYVPRVGYQSPNPSPMPAPGKLSSLQLPPVQEYPSYVENRKGGHYQLTTSSSIPHKNDGLDEPHTDLDAGEEVDLKETDERRKVQRKKQLYIGYLDKANGYKNQQILLLIDPQKVDQILSKFITAEKNDKIASKNLIKLEEILGLDAIKSFLTNEPDIAIEISKRGWDLLISTWKRFLHQFDDELLVKNKISLPEKSRELVRWPEIAAKIIEANTFFHNLPFKATETDELRQNVVSDPASSHSPDSPLALTSRGRFFPPTSSDEELFDKRLAEESLKSHPFSGSSSSD